MTNKKEYIDKMMEQLKEWSSKIDQLEFKARGAKADVKLAYEQRINELKDKRKLVMIKLQELKGASSEKWEAVKEGVENNLKEFKNAFTEIRDKLKKTG